MQYRISSGSKSINTEIQLPLSKSESNRALIICSLAGQDISALTVSDAEDTRTLLELLQSFKKGSTNMDVKAAGTTFRFLTAYFASRPCHVVLTGSERLKERPVGSLVNTLRQLGADIAYLEKEGFAPLEIKGKALKGGSVAIEGSVSSQFISALLMIGPTLENGLRLNIKGKRVSHPYIDMTLGMMKRAGVKVEDTKEGFVTVFQPYRHFTPAIEADWSAASYWYAIAALSKEARILLKGLKNESLQGDSILPYLFEPLGVTSTYKDNVVLLTKNAHPLPSEFYFDFASCPDLAQTVAVVLTALKIPSVLKGLQTLRLKETDRVSALKNELEKLGAVVEANDRQISIRPPEHMQTGVLVETYKDHRMAMSFAPLAVLGEIRINDPEVVQKSYPRFWDDLRAAGFSTRKD